MDTRRLFDSNESAQPANPTSATTDLPGSDTLIPYESPTTSRKRDLQYRIQHHANSPEQRDDEMRIRPGTQLALPAPESDLSDESMDHRSSSEDLNYSDESDLAISDHATTTDAEIPFESVVHEVLASTEPEQQIALLVAETVANHQISTALVETTRTITTRSMVARNSPPQLPHEPRLALTSSSLQTLEIVQTVRAIVLPRTDSTIVQTERVIVLPRTDSQAPLEVRLRCPPSGAADSTAARKSTGRLGHARTSTDCHKSIASSRTTKSNASPPSSTLR